MVKVEEEPTRILRRIEDKSFLEERVRESIATACAELNSEIRRLNLEIIATLPGPTRIAEFVIQHLVDSHENGIIRASVFTPIVGNDEEGNVVLNGFKITLLVHMHEASKPDYITIEEKSLLDTQHEKRIFQFKVMAFLRDIFERWAK